MATAVAYARRLGKSPIVVNDGPGFLVNRLLLPYMNEALLLFEEGAAIKQVERAAKAFGMPMGPITLYDVVGLDVAVHAGGVIAGGVSRPRRAVADPARDGRSGPARQESRPRASSTTAARRRTAARKAPRPRRSSTPIAASERKFSQRGNHRPAVPADAARSDARAGRRRRRKRRATSTWR